MEAIQKDFLLHLFRQSGESRSKGMVIQSYRLFLGRQHVLLSPFVHPPARTGRAVNGGGSPFILR